MQKKDYQGAVDSYKEALRNNPNEEETRYNLSEAIRKLKEEKKQQQNQQKNTDNQQTKNKKEPQNSKDKQDQQQKNQQNNTKTNNPKPKEQQKSPSRLPNKSVERMLDQLSKSEAVTKRKMGGSRQKENSIKSGKDW
jgi:Ca-activated chloride channel family protein